MFTFVVELLRGQPSMYVLVMLWVYLVLASKLLPALWYRPWREAHTATTSVIIPVVDEPPLVFADVLLRIAHANPDEVIVVINGPRNEPLEALCEGLCLRCHWLPTPGKRGALAWGIEHATGEICVLVDSDTRWEPDTLAELLKPFADPTIGGVTTHQRIWQPRGFVARFCDWLEAARFQWSTPAQSVFHQVGTLPGRTIAFRRSILVDTLAQFLAAPQQRSDDRDHTELTRLLGYGTVYQATARVWTECPTRLKPLIKQQFRWASGSQFNTLRRFGLLLRRAPFALWCFVADMITPFLSVALIFGAVWRIAAGRWGTHPVLSGTLAEPLAVQLLLIGVGVYAALLLRNGRQIVSRPSELLLIPLYWLLSLLVMIPIRIAGLAWASYERGWGTRRTG